MLHGDMRGISHRPIDDGPPNGGPAINWKKVQCHPSVPTKLGSIYHSVLEALGAYFDNAVAAVEAALAANSEVYGDHKPRICLALSPEEGIIEVRDPGIGITEKQLSNWADNVGDSQWEDKDRDDLTQFARGWGIGALSFQMMVGKEGSLSVYSTAMIDGRTFRLVMPKGDETGTNYHVVEIDGEKIRKRIGSNHGTLVRIDGIPKSFFTGTGLLTFNRIKSWIRTERRQVLKQKAIEIVLVKGNQRESLLPPDLPGQMIEIEPVLIASHNAIVEFDLSLAPPGSACSVAVTDAEGKTVVKNITEIPGMDCSPWNRPDLHGYIKCDFVEQTANREGLITTGEAFLAWQQAVNSRREVTETRINEAIEKRVSASRQELFLSAKARVEKALHEVQLTLSLPRLVKTQEDEQGEKKPRVPRARRPQTSTPRLGQQANPEELRIVWYEVKGIDWPRDSRSHSFFAYESGLLHINTGHPDFNRALNEGDRPFKDYAFLVTLEALLKHKFPHDPDIVAAFFVSCIEVDKRAKRRTGGER